jgi:hypothetical protein
VFGASVGEVGVGVVNDPGNKSQIDVDVVVFAPAAPGQSRRILSLGEAKWGEVMGPRHVERLRRARDLLAASYDTSDCVLACYSGAGFHEDLRGGADSDLVLVGLKELYHA